MIRIATAAALCACLATVVIVTTEVRLVPHVIWGTLIFAVLLVILRVGVSGVLRPIWLPMAFIGLFPGFVAGCYGGWFGRSAFAAIFAIFGFVGCVAIVVVSKLIGHYWLQRKEDYYDRKEDDE